MAGRGLAPILTTAVAGAVAPMYFSEQVPHALKKKNEDKGFIHERDSLQLLCVL